MDAGRPSFVRVDRAPPFVYVTAARLAVVPIDVVGSGPSPSLDAGPAAPALPKTPEECEEHPTAGSLDDEARRFTEIFLGLSAQRRALLALVHGRGVPKGRAGRMLGLAPYAVSRELKRAIGELRERLQLSRDQSWSPRRIDAWLRAWTHATAIVFEEHPSVTESGDDA